MSKDYTKHVKLTSVKDPYQYLGERCRPVEYRTMTMRIGAKILMDKFPEHGVQERSAAPRLEDDFLIRFYKGHVDGKRVYAVHDKRKRELHLFKK